MKNDDSIADEFKEELIINIIDIIEIDELTTTSSTFAPTENSSSVPIDLTSAPPAESPSPTQQPEKCGKNFVSSTTGIITLTVVLVLR